MTSDITRHIIPQGSIVIDAVRLLNGLPTGNSLTLFAVDQTGRMVGTVTDGDVRRAILGGCGLDCTVSAFMNRDFTWLPEDGLGDVGRLHDIKQRGLKLIPILDGERKIVKVLDFNRHNTFLPVDAVLMAGGKGERLRPLTLTTPKPLLKVGNKPIIDYNIDNLLRHGVEHIYVTTNYLAEQIEDYFAAPKGNGVQVNCVREPKYLGTMGSVRFVPQWKNDTVLVMNSDLFTNIDLEDFFMHFREHNADMSVAAVPYSVNVPYGIFELENTREIRGVREKPSFHYYANAGIYLIRRELLELIPEDTFFNATDMMELLVQRGHKVIRFPLSGYWIDIGKPEDFLKVQDLAHHIQKR